MSALPGPSSLSIRPARPTTRSPWRGIAAFEAFLRGIGVPTRLGEAKVAAPLPPAEYASDVKTVSFNADGVLPSHTPVSLDDVRQIFTLAL